MITIISAYQMKIIAIRHITAPNILIAFEAVLATVTILLFMALDQCKM